MRQVISNNPTTTRQKMLNPKRHSCAYIRGASIEAVTLGVLFIGCVPEIRIVPRDAATDADSDVTRIIDIGILDAPSADAPSVDSLGMDGSATDAVFPDVQSADLPVDARQADLPNDQPAIESDARDVLTVCSEGQARCGAECVDFSSEVRHCGACGNACSAREVCAVSSCIVARCRSGSLAIPEGQFLMGSTLEIDQRPVHGVRLSSFCMDEAETTVDAYAACVAAGACTAPETEEDCNWMVTGRGQHPVNCVTWFQSRQYCQWRGGDLPTESQWEYAARGTDGRFYPWGLDLPTSQTCWSGINRRSSTCQVRSNSSGNSAFGVFDMAGNIWEWTLDWYGPYRGDSTSYVLNPAGGPSAVQRVIRGGGWDSTEASRLSSTFRFPFVPAYGFSFVGFRCVSAGR